MTETDPVNQATIDLIKRNEGCVLHAYRDSVGVATIGYGHTANVHIGMQITQAQAEAYLRDDLATFENAVDDLLSEDADTTDNQYGAMVSLAYNIGPSNFARSTVLRLHNAGDHRGAADAFRMWNRAGGVVLSGLTRRREEERTLYLTPDQA